MTARSDVAGVARRFGENIPQDPPLTLADALACEHPALESKYAIDGDY